VGDCEASRIVHAFGFPDQDAEKTHFAIKIPWLTGLVATRSVDTP
jgi:cytochrome d ubiquinol oxidase subunit I